MSQKTRTLSSGLHSGPSRKLQIRVAATTLAASMAFAAQSQTLFNVSEQASAGDVISITGSGFASNSRVTVTPILANGAYGASATAEVVSQSGSTILAKLPGSGPDATYAVAVDNGGAKSKPLYVNQTRPIWQDLEESVRGAKVRIVGRNLKMGSTMPTVRLVDGDTGVSYPAAVSAASSEQITFLVPTAAPVNRSFRVLVSNGLSGSTSEVESGARLTVRTSVADSFGLGTPWASEFLPAAGNVYNLKSDPRLKSFAAGDGKADDTQALKDAILAANRAGGGTIYLPAGAYRVDSGSLELLKGVVLKGDGMGRTILQVGYRFTAASPAPGGYYWMCMNRAGSQGVTALTIQNLNSGPTANGTLRGGPNGENGVYLENTFLTDVDFQQGNAVPLLFNGLSKALITRCKFTTTSTQYGPILMDAGRYVRMEGNAFDYRVGRVSACRGYRNVLDKNTLLMNNAYRGAGGVESGGIELSFGRDVLVSGNTLTGYGKYLSAPDYDDGELIMTQLSNIGEFSDVGTVGSAAGLKLMPLNRTWMTGSWVNTKCPGPDRKVVAIIAGKGTGQVRFVADHDADSLTIDRPWDVAPDGTSTYAVQTLSANDLTVVGNRLENGSFGVSFYDGALDSIIADNTLVNAGYIGVRADSRLAKITGSTYRHTFAWYNDVRGNALTNSNGVRPAAITVSAIVNDINGNGALVLGTDVRKNSIVGGFSSAPLALGAYDGYENQVCNFRGSADRTNNAGTVFSGNTVSGAKTPYRLSNADACNVALAIATSF